MYPVPDRLRIGEKTLKHVFVIASKADGAMPNHSNRKEINDASGIGAAVDVIAEIDLDRMRDRPPLQVLVDAIDEFGQKIVAPMDVADGIDANIRRKSSGRSQGTGKRRAHLRSGK